MDIPAPDLQQFLVLSFLYLFIISGLFILIVVISRRKIKEKQLKMQLMAEQFENERVKIELEAGNDAIKRVSMELHDDLIPSLASINIMIGMIQLGDDDDAQQKMYQSTIEKVSRDLQLKVRGISHLLNDHFESYDTMAQALYHITETFSEMSRCEYSIEDNLGTLTIDPQYKTCILKVLKELIYNSYKYAKATKAEIKIDLSGNRIKTVFIDNGIGMNSEDTGNGIGIANIKSRIAQLKGSYAIETAPGKGYCFSFELPIG